VFIAGKNVWPLPMTNGSWETRGFSGHWMAFYGAAFAVLYSAIHKPSLLEARKCPAGHDVSHQDLFCPKCGQALSQ
jgi:hypothetical protein